MKHLILLVGPPGSGKYTFAKTYGTNLSFVRISQDNQGKGGHWEAFEAAMELEQNIITPLQCNYGNF